MQKPEDKAAFTTRQLGLLIACAIMGLWLLSFAIGYDFGRDLGHQIFANKG